MINSLDQSGDAEDSRFKEWGIFDLGIWVRRFQGHGVGMAHSTQAFIMPAIAAFNIEQHRGGQGRGEGVIYCYSTAALWAQHLIPKSNEACTKACGGARFRTTLPELRLKSMLDSILSTTLCVCIPPPLSAIASPGLGRSPNEIASINLDQ